MSISLSNNLGMDLLSKLQSNKENQNDSIQVGKGQEGQSSFMDHLKDAIKTLNYEQKDAEAMTTQVITGKTENIHEAMLSMSHAELNFKYMVQVRNKVLESYQEVMRMPV